jgi:hypothetical protein
LSALEKAGVAPYAAKALTGIKGFFTAMMGKALYDQTPEVVRVLNDPKSTREQKIAAVSGEAVTGLDGVNHGQGRAGVERADGRGVQPVRVRDRPRWCGVPHCEEGRVLNPTTTRHAVHRRERHGG